MVPVISLVGFGLLDRGFPVVCCAEKDSLFFFVFLCLLHMISLKSTKMMCLINYYQVGRCVEIGIPMLILFVAFSQVMNVVRVKFVIDLPRISWSQCASLF